MEDRRKSILLDYQKHNRKKLWFRHIVFLLILIASLAAILAGPSDIKISNIIGLFNGAADEFDRQIILNIRLPRIAAALLSGMALSVTGVVMQSILRNPLASPFTLGISNAAAFGAAFAIVIVGTGRTLSATHEPVIVSNPLLTTAFAFIWSLAACVLILIVARKRGATPENMILTGIIASALFTALTTGLQYIADDVQIAAVVFWSFGDLSRGSWNDLALQSAIIIPSAAYFFLNRWNYNALDAGDEAAHSAGINISRLRITGMIIASLTTAAVVSFYGIIAFVGLAVPHMVRRISGSNEMFLIPDAALAGSLFMLVCDLAARTIISPMVLPVGILTSLIGAPLFIFLLIRGIGSSQWK